jgi:exodeoxyribonuclease V alpha subunit
VIDEASMVDVCLAADLLRGLSETVRIVMVGDPNQIPSVGAGALLRDMIATASSSPEGATLSELSIVHRHEGSIARNALEVLHGCLPRVGEEDWYVDTGDGASPGFSWLEGVRRQVDEGFAERIMDGQVQLLSPVKRGPGGTAAINRALQALIQEGLEAFDAAIAEFDSGDGDIKPARPKPGDRIIWTVNDYELGIFNGTQGTLVRKGLIVTDDDVEVEIGDRHANSYELGYCLTIHKSQGSEWPEVIVCLPRVRTLEDRSLLYTGITRARERVVLIGDQKALSAWAWSSNSTNRQTLTTC